LSEKVDRAHLSFDTQLAEVLLGRPDLSHAQIEKEFGISKKVVRRDGTDLQTSEFAASHAGGIERHQQRSSKRCAVADDGNHRTISCGMVRISIKRRSLGILDDFLGCDGDTRGAMQAGE